MSSHTGLGDPLMLERIDKLIACGIASLINLPQIVVVGDQSSGKSSVLAGLIRKELPRDSGLCTRFATNIIFRRSEQEGISASIIADTHASEDHRTAVEAWTRSGLELLEQSTFTEVMREVHQVMGLSMTGSSSTSGPTFSNDIFRLEISGPDQEHLSVIDVPGIFKNTTPGVTKKSDITLVRNMVLEYMNNPRSVMLAVVPANVDVATQEILELALDVDPTGDRTLGVLTKPDLVDTGAEHRVIDLVENRTRQMKLGWHIVRNLGQQQLNDPSLDRNAMEMDFFRSAKPWKEIEKDKVGVENLRERLRDVLSGLVRREFPKVKQEIKKKLQLAEKSLKDIGPERSTTQAQCAFLTDLATSFQRLVMLALNAKYAADDLFEQLPELRLAPSVSARYIAFSHDMANRGHTYAFLKPEASFEEPKQEGTGSLSTAATDPSPDVTKVTAARKMITRYHEDDEAMDIESILHARTELDAVNTTDTAKWLRDIYASGRGFDIGSFDASILALAMKKQSTKWSDIGLGYISDVIVIVHHFIMSALNALCFDEALTAALTSTLSEGLTERYRKSIAHVEFLLEIERDDTPMTVNHYFNDNLQKSQQARLQAAMARVAFDDVNHGKVVRIDDTKVTNHMSNASHTVQDIHDNLQAYYKLARKRFVDNVLKQATFYYLINGPDTPLKFFSPAFVNNLAAEELEDIAGEDPKTKKLRARLTKEIASLRDAWKILARG